MTMTAEPDSFTPHASSTAALKEAVLALTEAQDALKDVDLRSLKGDMREFVKNARAATDAALKTARKR